MVNSIKPPRRYANIIAAAGPGKPVMPEKPPMFPEDQALLRVALDDGLTAGNTKGQHHDPETKNHK